MLVRHLGYFVTLAREQHFARAAAACCISQPTLSAAIRKLEEDLQIRLVVRGQRFVGLTPEGDRVLAWARQMLTDYDSLKADLSGSRHGLEGTLRIGVIPAAMPAVSMLTRRFCAAHPSARVRLDSMPSSAIQSAIDAFEIEAGLTYLENEPLVGVRRVPLYAERYLFIAADRPPHSGRETISWADASRERLCLLETNMQNRRIIDKVAASVSVAMEPTVTCSSYLAVLAHVRDGHWAAIVPHTFVGLFGPTPDMVALELVDPVHTEMIGLVVSDRDPLSPLAGALLTTSLRAEQVRHGAREERCGRAGSFDASNTRAKFPAAGRQIGIDERFQQREARLGGFDREG